MKAIAFAATIAAFATPAFSQMQCGPYETLPDYLEGSKEQTIAHSGYAVAEVGVVIVEIYTAEDGSWTMVMVRPDGVACIIGFGDGWKDEVGGEPA